MIDIDFKELISFSTNGTSVNTNTLCKDKIAKWLKQRRFNKKIYHQVSDVLRDLGYHFSFPMTWTKETIDDLRCLHNIDLDELIDIAAWDASD